MKNIVDDPPIISSPYFKLVFWKGPHLKELSWGNFAYLTLIEVLFGSELLEQLSLTASFTEPESPQTGQLLHLSDLVPAGLFTNYFRKSLYQVFYYKFYKQYKFLTSDSSIDEGILTSENGDLNLTTVRFAVRHAELFQLIAFRRVYLLSWLAVNFLIDAIVFVFTKLLYALLAAVSIEGIRRLTRL